MENKKLADTEEGISFEEALRRLQEIDPTLNCEIYFSNTVQTV